MIQRIYRKKEFPIPPLLELIVDRWTTLIVREIFFDVHRFEQLYNNLGISRNILSVRLQHLVEAGILELKRYNDYPARFEYHFTKKGLDLYPFISTLKKWGDKWLTGKNGPPQVVYHNLCKHVFVPVAICSYCSQEIKIGEINYEEKSKVKYFGGGRLLDSRKRKPSKKVRQVQDICTVEGTLNVIGDRWTFSILREAFLDNRRFEQFYNELGISRSILSSRLKDLVRNGIFTKHRYLDNPSRYEYRLSKKGLDIFPTILASICWENRWRVYDDKPPLLLRHTACNHTCDVIIICAQCGVEIQAHEIKYVKLRHCLKGKNGHKKKSLN